MTFVRIKNVDFGRCWFDELSICAIIIVIKFIIVGSYKIKEIELDE